MRMSYALLGQIKRITFQVGNLILILSLFQFYNSINLFSYYDTIAKKFVIKEYKYHNTFI